MERGPLPGQTPWMAETGRRKPFACGPWLDAETSRGAYPNPGSVNGVVRLPSEETPCHAHEAKDLIGVLGKILRQKLHSPRSRSVASGRGGPEHEPLKRIPANAQEPRLYEI